MRSSRHRTAWSHWRSWPLFVRLFPGSAAFATAAAQLKAACVCKVLKIGAWRKTLDRHILRLCVSHADRVVKRALMAIAGRMVSGRGIIDDGRAIGLHERDDVLRFAAIRDEARHDRFPFSYSSRLLTLVQTLQAERR